MSTNLIVVTDLDGTLLDHHSYEFKPAMFMIASLKRHDIPIVFNSSKTYAEMRYLQDQMGLLDPMIAENGAAIYLPKHRFSPPLKSWEDSGDFWRLSLAKPRGHWLRILAQYPDQASVLSFSYLGVQGVMNVSGLDWAAAERASQRDYTEPLMAPSDAGVKDSLVHYLHSRGARIQQGGRFMTVGDNVDKGRALRVLVSLLESLSERPVHSLGLGDGLNDISMLEQADERIWIRSPVNATPDCVKQKGWYVTSDCGPEAWASAMRWWLEKHSYLINSNKSEDRHG